jgi:hypothetical protein
MPTETKTGAIHPSLAPILTEEYEQAKCREQKNAMQLDVARARLEEARAEYEVLQRKQGQYTSERRRAEEAMRKNGQEVEG